MAGLSAVSGGEARREEDQIVPVYDLAFVGGPQFAGEIPGGAAEQLGDLLRVEVDESAGDRGAVRIAQFDRVMQR